MPSVGIGTNWLGPPVPPPIRISLPTRVGLASAKATVLWPPIELPMICTRSRFNPSSTALRVRALSSERDVVQTIGSLLFQPRQSSRITR